MWGKYKRKKVWKRFRTFRAKMKSCN
jgi:hypothetical protein